jgi:aryl-alcohol dehydrogenase-like predicted oxidoreductase
MTEGRLATLAGSTNPAFAKLSAGRNWELVAELEHIATRLGHSMAQVALNWVANRPGVASVLVGATRPEQLRDNLQALDFDLPANLAARLDAVSAPTPRFPYSFFGPEIQGMVHGARVGAKPSGYAPMIVITGNGAGVSA